MLKQILSKLRIGTGCQGPKRVITKFSKGKDTNSIRRVKKNLKGMDLSSAGIRSRVHKNDSSCKYYKMFWQKCKKPCVNKFIHFFWVSNGSIRLKLSENERSYIITHINDLEELLLGNEFIRDEEQVIYFQLRFIFNLVC